ncbi:hypothetical protein ACDX78_02320 [Virgibacillus oceani]
MEIKLNIEAKGLESAIHALAQAISGGQETAQQPAPQQQEQVQQQAPVQQEAPAQQQAPTQQPPVQQQQQQQASQQQGAVPTSNPEYTFDQLAVAATQLMDAGKQNELLGLLNSTFGVQALTELPKEQFGAFATKLRELGAKI